MTTGGAAFPGVDARLSRGVAAGEIPGAAAVVFHRCTTHRWHGGWRDREAGDAIGPDTLFRIASLTKTVTSVVAMRLVEEGRLGLTDPVERYLPRLAALRVGVPGNDGALHLAPAGRPVTVHDLMRHTSGFTYGQFSDHPVQRLYREAGMAEFDQTSEDLLRKLADLPLMYPPGTTFAYGMSTDVLGWLLEAVAEKDMETLVREVVALPLGLASMTFWPDEGARRRIAQPQVDPATGEYPVLGSRNFYEAGWVSGGHGLFATCDDFARFGLMLLRRGTLDGVRILSRKTVELMTSNHLPPGIAFAEDVSLLGPLAPTPELGQGFGLGFFVRTAPGRNPLPGSVGDFGWAGLSGTYFWADPAEDLASVLMMQAPVQRTAYREVMRQAVYGDLP